MLALSLGTTAWWQSLDDAARPTAVPGDGEPQVDEVGGFDQAFGRDLRIGAERVLAEVYAPAAELYFDWGDWSQVTPAAIGASITNLGLVGPDVAPARADEISMLVNTDGVVFGTLDLDGDTSDCIWLRDGGLGPEIVHDAAENCSASEAPPNGWEPVDI